MNSIRRSAVIGLILVMLFALLAVAHAQDTIAYGDTVTGELTASLSTVRYEFEGTEGDTVRISMSSDDFDTYLYLDDPSGDQVAYNDDGGEGTNSTISAYTLSETGTYTIRATHYSDSGVGDFELTLEEFQLRLIETGQVVEDEGDGGEMTFGLIGQQGDTVVITLRAEGYDTYAYLIGPDGFQAASSNYTDGQNVRLGPYTLDQAGQYTLNFTATGNYTLSYNTVEAIEVTVGDSTTGQFESGVNALYFTFEATTNEVLDITVDSGSTLDTRLSLMGPYNYEVGSSDDGDGTVDPALSSVVIDSDGLYYVVVEPQNPNARLQGEITLSVLEAELAQLGDDAVTFEFGDTVQEQVATMEGVADETVRVEVVIDTDDIYASPTLSFVQNGTTVAYISLQGINYAKFDFITPEDGQIRVTLNSYSEATLQIDIERNPEK